jgi:prepilin-type N-terminal cleavage/methylation domain-containing protein
MHHSQPFSRGFTLVEILVMVVIIGIAGAIIVPQMGSRDDLKLSSASRMLTADLLYLQNMAISRQRNHFVAFDVPGQRYTLLDGSMLAVLTHPLTRDPYTVRFGKRSASGLSDVKLVSATFVAHADDPPTTLLGFDELGTPVIFDAGTILPLSDGSIILQSGKDKLKVSIGSYTGQINVGPAN